MSSTSATSVEASISLVAIVVRDYDEAIKWYCDVLDFTLVEDTFQPEQNKRWVVVKPAGDLAGTSLLLARASNDEQEKFVGNQCGGRVFLFLQTSDFWSSWNKLKSKNVTIVRDPVEQPCKNSCVFVLNVVNFLFLLLLDGWVAVFADLYGNRYDLLQRKAKVEPTTTTK